MGHQVTTATFFMVDYICGKDRTLFKLLCEFSCEILVTTGDLELLSQRLEKSHWKNESISIHPTAILISFHLHVKVARVRKNLHKQNLYSM